MKKLSEYEGDEALELTADLIVPIAIIFSDKEVMDIIKSHKKNFIPMAVKKAIKNHCSEVKEVIAILDGVDVKDLQINIASLPSTVLCILNDGDLVDFFMSQFQTWGGDAFGTVTEITKENEK